MYRIEDQVRKLAAVTSVVVMAAAEAMAQDSLPKPSRRIVVSFPDHKLAVMESDRVIKIFPAAVGAPDSPSPTGLFKIVNSISDPTWYGKGKVVPPGPDSPIGPHWLGLDLKGYGIHGTNAPNSIGRDASHGCIRLRNRDIQELAGMVRVGDQVELHAERTPELDQIFGQPSAPATRTIAAVGAAQ